jgi:hypothetical protein
MSETADKILAELASLAQRIEAHRSAIWLLEAEQQTLRIRLRASGWQPPKPAEAAA